MRTLKPLALMALVLTLCVLPKLTAEEKLDLPGTKSTPKQGEAPAVRRYPWESADAAAIRATLEFRVPSVRMDGMPFHEVVDQLRDLTLVNILVNWSALETAAIEQDKEISLAAENMRFDHLIALMLDEVGGGEVELDYQIWNNAIVISTREDIARRTSVQIYNVRDLLDMAGPVLSNCPRCDDSDRLLRLVSIIQTTVDPESWREAGGNTGAINDYADLLIITQTQTAHNQIWDLLEKMRSALRDR